MDRYITTLSPVRAQEDITKQNQISEALGLNSPILCPQSPTKLGSPTRPPKLSPFKGAAFQLDPVLSPKKLIEAENEKDKQSLQVKYIIETGQLRDDFYSTLLAICPVTDYLAVGLRRDVRLWHEQTGIKIPLLPQSWGTVTSLDFNSQGILAIGYSLGCLCLYDQAIDIILSRVHLPKGNYPTTIKFKTDRVLYCGDSKGIIHLIQLGIKNGRDRLTVRDSKPASNGEIISGLEFNDARNRLVVGANDGNITVWETGPLDMNALYMLTKWSHAAAVKAITFFPTMSNLAVTGGGRADKTLRVYDISTFELMQTIKVPAQVTGLVWIGNFELFVAMGHASGDPKRVGQVYRFQNGRIMHVYDIGEEMSARSIYACKTKTGVAVGLNTKKILFLEWSGKNTKGNARGFRREANFSPIR